MWRGDKDLGLNKETYCLDTAHRPSSDTPRVDPQAAVPHMALTTSQGSAMDTCAYGVVQDMRMSNYICAGRDGKRTKRQEV